MPPWLLSLELAQESGFLQQEFGFVVLLSIAAVVAILVRRFVRLPYTVALVLVGLILSIFPNFLGLNVSSDLILDLLVPPLIFEATLQIRWSALRRDLVP
ncbi:MAG: cation:proton antiporter, partial [Anaerolineales bacterium]|nr:cation:proton antiporter [Anaerolineales bacterium]